MADVVVVGSGIIGLTVAARLRERGADVAVWTAHDTGETVSAVAAAVWYPTRTEAGPRVLGWAAATYARFTREAADGVPGVLLRRTRTLLRKPLDELPWWAAATPDAELVTGEEPYAQEIRFTAPLVEMDRYLAGLQERVVASGVTLVRRRPDRLADAFAAAPVVVNATGLAARELAGDPAVSGVRGHIVVVANPGLDVSLRDEENPAGITYVHPRSADVVLGGTFDPDRRDVEPDAAEADAILRRCVALEPRLAGAPVLGERIGLRPVRAGGPRVAAEQTAAGRLVHAYGHGGAGMTLSWGCADEVADLALTHE